MLLSLIEKSFIHLFRQPAFLFSSKGHCYRFSCHANRDFEHKSNCVDEFHKPVKFQANQTWVYPDITFLIFPLFSDS